MFKPFNQFDELARVPSNLAHMHHTASTAHIAPLFVRLHGSTPSSQPPHDSIHRKTNKKPFRNQTKPVCRANSAMSQ